MGGIRRWDESAVDGGLLRLHSEWNAATAKGLANDRRMPRTATGDDRSASLLVRLSGAKLLQFARTCKQKCLTIKAFN